MTDYYNVLGIASDASEEDVKRAYRKLALRYHPDKNPTADATRFQEIQTAYETLSDPAKRRDYDNPNPVPEINFAGGGFPFDHFFANRFFGPQQHRSASVRKLGDHQYNVKIGLRDVYFGTSKRLKTSRTRICRDCNSDCDRCHGNGSVTHRINIGPLTQMITQTCDVCAGRGVMKRGKPDCGGCKGKGETTEERIFEITIPKGVSDGKQFVFEEWGEQAYKSGDISGNLIVTISVESDSNFVRQGNDLLYTVNLSLVESIVGKELRIPHFDGDINIHSGGFGIINPNKMYTVFDRGIMSENTKGHLHLKFVIEYPQKTLSNSERELLKSAFQKTIQE